MQEASESTEAPGSLSDPHAVQHSSNRLAHESGAAHRSPISSEIFIRETDDASRHALAEALTESILFFLERDRAVWCEGLGILAPHLKTGSRSRVHGTSIVVRAETRRSLIFEKCSELVSFQRERFPQIVESKELAENVYPRLPFALQVAWSQLGVRRLLKGFFKLVVHEVVVKGHSDRLATLGDFCSLHNRQGDNISDWYAGADIFLVPSYRRVLSVGSTQLYKRPVLTSPWELLEAGYGAPVEQFTIDLAAELTALGYAPHSKEQRAAHTEPPIRAAVFRAPPASNSTKSHLIFCTDGLRHRAYNSERKNASGVECIVQFEVDENGAADSSVPHWPARMIVMAWVLITHSATGALQPRSGLSCGVPLSPEAKSSGASTLTAIFTTPFTAGRLEQLSPEGPFRFLTLVGITEDEAQIAERSSPQLLAMLLQHRGLDQITKPVRSSMNLTAAAEESSSLLQASSKFERSNLKNRVESTDSAGKMLPSTAEGVSHPIL